MNGMRPDEHAAIAREDSEIIAAERARFQRPTPTLRQLLRDAMERGHDPIGDHFDAVARVVLATLAACAIALGAIVWMVNA